MIDAHLHVWRAIPDYPEPAATTLSPCSDVPIELLEQYMEECNVERAVLVQPVYYGEDNSYVADSAAAKPHRFAAVCVVDPRKRSAAEQLEYWVRERSCRGLRLRPRMDSESDCFGAESTFDLWAKAAELSIPINVLGNIEHLSQLGQLAERFAEVTIIVDHFAHPRLEEDADDVERLLSLAQFPNVWLKVSGFPYFSHTSYPFADCRELVESAVNRFGIERLLWGSDFPHVLLQTGYQRSVRLMERAFPFLSEADRNRIGHTNAIRLYWPDESTP